MNKEIKVKTSESGLFNHNKLHQIKRNEKPNIFSKILKKNVTKYLFDFLYIRELSNICSANIFLYNCFQDYIIPDWKTEMQNIIDIFNLDVKNIKDEAGESLQECIEKHHMFPIKDKPGNFVRIDEEGINLISLVYDDPDMQKQLDKLKNNNNNNNINHFNFEALKSIEFDDDLDEINPLTLKTPWQVIHSDNSYKPGNIIFLEEKSTLYFGFSFNHVIKGNYKFYLHQSIINMKNANLILQILINDQVVLEINNFPSKKILNQFNNDNYNYNNTDINLKETYICDINEYMFNAVNNDLKQSKSIKDELDTKNSINSEGSTESNSSLHSLNSTKTNYNKRDYTVRIIFKNKHLFWKAGWYLDGGRLVRSFNKDEK